jgi:putative tricarboxylic transport membrane protein
MEAITALLAGTFYGMLIGIIPAAGATTGLVMLFGFVQYFSDPYLGVVFCMAVVAASTTGDSITSILLGIPGANSAAATMVDGFPLALQGRATYAISAAVCTSTVNGLIWGSLVFMLLPYYTGLLLYFGIPELWAFTMLALATVGFVSSRYRARSFLALAVGILLGLVGVDPATNEPRFTLGWYYLEDGLQLMPVVAGLFAIPELLHALCNRTQTATVEGSQWQQTLDGLRATWQHRWLALRGGFIGAFIGVLPGLGGAMADWMAYGQAVATTPDADPPMGKGNIRGVIGPEGANNAQKATSMLPTVLFGIPGAPFAAIIMALFMYLDFELGSLDLAADTRFFDSMTYGFMWGTVIVGILCIVFARYLGAIARVPYRYYFPFLLLFICWACLQYTGGWQDLFVLLIFSLLGIACKHYQFSRPSLLIGFILADRIEALSIQLTTIYSLDMLADRWVFWVLLIAVVAVGFASIYKKTGIDYA